MFGTDTPTAAQVARSWIALAIFILVALCMAMAQLYSDGLAEYPPGCAPLHDLGFEILPVFQGISWATTTYWGSLADVWAMAAYVIFTALVLWACRDVWTTKIRFSVCITYILALRTIVLLCTRYPKVPSIHDAYADYPNVFLSAILVLVGVRTTQTDYMFSGHTTAWIQTALFFWHYRKPGNGYTALALLFWAFNVAGIFLLIGARTHYTADVVVSIIINVLTFTSFHLVVEPENMYTTRLIRWMDSPQEKK
jgi:hypothetical protein